jgi:hypothetical protein
LNMDNSANSKVVSNQGASTSSSDLVTSSAKANMEASSTRKSLTSIGNSLKK